MSYFCQASVSVSTWVPATFGLLPPTGAPVVGGALVGAVIYNAIFVMVSVATTRAIAVGLLYVLIWEVVLANFVSGARLLSVSHYALGIANGFVNDSALNAGLNVATSVIMGAIVTVLALALAIRLLSSFTLKGEPA